MRTSDNMRKVFKLLCVATVACLVGQGCTTPRAKEQALFNSLARIGKVRCLEGGVFECNKRKGEASEDSPTGYLMDLQNVRSLKHCKNIPAELNTTFGILYFVPSAYTNVSARFIYSFPPIQNPTTGKTFTKYEREGRLSSKPGAFTMIYTFAEDYEIVSGTWTFQIFAKDELVVEERFTVSQKTKPSRL
jgi:hypothetical protein